MIMNGRNHSPLTDEWKRKREKKQKQKTEQKHAINFHAPLIYYCEP